MKGAFTHHTLLMNRYGIAQCCSLGTFVLSYVLVKIKELPIDYKVINDKLTKLCSDLWHCGGKG